MVLQVHSLVDFIYFLFDCICILTMDYPTLRVGDGCIVANENVVLSLQYEDGSRIDYMKNGTVYAWLVEGDWLELMGYIYESVHDYNEYNWYYRGDIDMDTHEKHGFGILYYDDGSVYKGEFLDNEPHGEGTNISGSDGSVFIGRNEDGQLVHGILTGREYVTRTRVVHGVNVYTKVFVDYEYEGDFKDGKYHGLGTLTRDDGYVLQGYFLEGALHGFKSTISDPVNGFFYEGSVYYNRPFGEGRARWEDGRTFVGKYSSLECCKGTMTWPNGDVYEGSLEFELLDGQGVMTCADGRVYTGEFECDEPEGAGKMCWPTGDSYEGAFVNGKIDMNAVGTFTFGNAIDNSGTGASISGKPSGFMSQFVNLEDYVVSMSRCVAV